MYQMYPFQIPEDIRVMTECKPYYPSIQVTMSLITQFIIERKKNHVLSCTIRSNECFITCPKIYFCL